MSSDYGLLWAIVTLVVWSGEPRMHSASDLPTAARTTAARPTGTNRGNRPMLNPPGRRGRCGSSIIGPASTFNMRPYPHSITLAVGVATAGLGPAAQVPPLLGCPPAAPAPPVPRSGSPSPQPRRIALAGKVRAQPPAPSWRTWCASRRLWACLPDNRSARPIVGPGADVIVNHVFTTFNQNGRY
jgi:hypothetical protein